MPARRLDGVACATRIREALAPRIGAFTTRHGRPPGLGVVLAGQNPASEVYVRNKIKTVGAAQCRGELFRLDASASLDDALGLVQRLNADDTIDGILVQSPLPEGMGADAEQRVFDAIDPAKDVDGFHPYNVGLLVQKRPALVACTPLGCIELLEQEQIPLRGKHAVVIGRSDLVGKPMAMLLLHENATVTICHSRTKDLASVTQNADILVAAIGRAGFVRGEHIGEGATVIDVGINNVSDKEFARELFAKDDIEKRFAAIDKRGFTLVGDVNPKEAMERAANFTPVPGGVGLLTVAMLMKNTVKAAKMRRGISNAAAI